MGCSQEGAVAASQPEPIVVANQPSPVQEQNQVSGMQSQPMPPAPVYNQAPYYGQQPMVQPMPIMMVQQPMPVVMVQPVPVAVPQYVVQQPPVPPPQPVPIQQEIVPQPAPQIREPEPQPAPLIREPEPQPASQIKEPEPKPEPQIQEPKPKPALTPSPRNYTDDLDGKIKRIVDKWFDDLDQDKKGYITFTEAKPYIKQHLVEDLELEGGSQAQEDAFFEIDTNADQQLTKSEMINHIKEHLKTYGEMASLGVTSNAQTAPQIQEPEPKPASTPSPRNYTDDLDGKIKRIVDKWFDDLDQDKKGYITFTEAKPYIKKHLVEDLELEGGSAAQEDAFFEMDSNADRQLIKEEMVNHIQQHLEIYGEMASQGITSNA